ncbi:DUF1440 domain-containing protein [Geomonas sp. Red69]|uniref:DUF1440 domain-containing protein n=1 Tax=Geomonas diazotrophica TaxID=2843197 RepID=UPI001C0FF07B|nr:MULTISPECIES: DUF1440 domain-containing protein [Geomonas]MBU5638238.1 DUF1440 domain-containing protein [Geomonas diazotrophica]QXE85855.1 DUF1440 domain-containing protein [Geomonas nitrogeniifigens]
MSKEGGLRSLAEGHPVLVAMAAGLVAGAVAAVSDRMLDPLVTQKQKRRDRRVREAPAHRMAGPHFGAKLLGRRLDAREKKRARALFGVIYGLGWGVIHGRLTGRYPFLTRWGGLPFAVPFFFACDGLIAPSLGLSPRLGRIPWQPSAKELGNHIAWTAAAELVHRVAGVRS